MAKRKTKRVPKSVLKLADLEQSKSAVLSSLSSPSSQRSYDHAIREFVEWYCSEPRGELEKIQFLLGHVPVQTTERYLGCKQRFKNAVNDSIGIEPLES